jgi:hypothetical protein
MIVMNFSPVVYGTDVASIISNLPKSYSGEFEWRRSVRKYQVTINFNRVRELPTGQVEARGTAVYNEYGTISRVSLRAVIYPETLYFEMYENEQRSTELAGLYQGDLSADLQTMTARWANFLDKRRGVLNVTANTKTIEEEPVLFQLPGVE